MLLPIKLIAIDLYGTLVGPGGHGELPPENRDAVMTALKRGIKIALVTGLNRGSVMNILQKSGIQAVPGLMVACYNGAVMFEPATDSMIWEYSLTAELVAELVGHPDIKPHFPMVHGPFDDRNLMWIEGGNHPPIVQQYLEHRVESIGSSSTQVVDDLARAMTFPVQDISFLAPENSIDSATDRLDDQYSGKVKVIKSLWREGYAWLEILHPSSGKGEAVKHMLERFRLNRDDVMSIGDNLNDIEMFEQSGISVAMGNASEKVRQSATHKTLTWDQAGVAHAMKTWTSAD
jgi:Cof subfamily protein (haloacid dehalogenase superfamily)